MLFACLKPCLCCSILLLLALLNSSVSILLLNYELLLTIFITGWDKTFCLQYVSEFEEIHFFGDKTFEGGNDYEIFSHEKVKGHTVTSPEDTMKQLKDLFDVSA